MRQIQARTDQATAYRLSVWIELQADCFAGVWGHHTAERGIINHQDVTTALQTAAQIGDDYLQRRARGVVVPETFTHGSSQQRVHWFERGLTSGDMRQCDTNDELLTEILAGQEPQKRLGMFCRPSAMS